MKICTKFLNKRRQNIKYKYKYLLFEEYIIQNLIRDRPFRYVVLYKL